MIHKSIYNCNVIICIINTVIIFQFLNTVVVTINRVLSHIMMITMRGRGREQFKL